jgi:WD40 repeat protein
MLLTLDDEKLFTTDCMGNCQEWHVGTGVLIKDHKSIAKQDIWRLMLAPSGKSMFIIELKGGIRQWSTDSVQCMKDYGMAHDAGCSTATLGPNGDYMFTGGKDGAIRQWGLKGQKNGQILLDKNKCHTNPIRTMKCTHSG